MAIYMDRVKHGWYDWLIVDSTDRNQSKNLMSWFFTVDGCCCRGRVTSRGEMKADAAVLPAVDSCGMNWTFSVCYSY